jgi:hypothetical protein
MALWQPFPGQPLQQRPKWWWTVAVLAAASAFWIWRRGGPTWIVVSSTVFLCFLLVVEKLARRRQNRLQALLGDSRRATVLTHDPANHAAIDAMLRTIGIDVRELDGHRIRSVADLASELDRVLGPFEHPTDPHAKVTAHIGHERRGTGERVLLWREARRLQAHDPAGFDRFLCDWSRAMANGADRLLFVDTAPSAS